MRSRYGEEKIDVIILAGGVGSRLRAVVADVPKVLAPVNGVPFLDILLARLNRYCGIGKVVLAVGYRAEMIMARYANGQNYRFPIEFSVEKELLGTAGGIRQASEMTTSETVLVGNGDTFVGASLYGLVRAHRQRGALVTVVVKRVRDANRYGSLDVDNEGMVVAFQEKREHPGGGNSLINAGLYAMNRAAFDYIGAGKSSLEMEVLPRLTRERLILTYLTNGKFLDIGIPETYLAAGDYLRGVLEPARAGGKR